MFLNQQLLTVSLLVVVNQVFTLRNLHDEPVEVKEEGTVKNETKHPKLEAYAKTAHLRPTKCQVCRVLMQELWHAVNNTNNVMESLWLTNRLDGEDKNGKRQAKKIDYSTSELRLMDILENICNKVYDYRSIAGPDFPYLKGVKSMFRQQLEELMGKTKLKLTLDAPQAMVEDPTMELRRMHYECNQMVETYEDEIIIWYSHKQNVDPVNFLCADRIIPNQEQECLTASTDIPDFAKHPSKATEEPISFTNGKKMEL